MASSNTPDRPPPEADIPAKAHPSSSKDQALVAGPPAGPKPYGYTPEDLPMPAQATSNGPSTAAGEPLPQHSDSRMHTPPPAPASYGPDAPAASAAYPSFNNHSYGQYHPAGPDHAAGRLAGVMPQHGPTGHPAGNGGRYAPEDHLQHSMQHPMQQQQQAPVLGSPTLPEAAPAPKTDPVELSLLTKYLEVVRQTQGEAAAAQAMAASGLPSGTSLDTGTGTTSHSASTQLPTGSSSAPFTTSSASSAAAAPIAAGREHGSNGGTPTAAGGGSSSAAAAASLAEPLAINNLLGFIKQRKLAGVARQQPRRSSSGSAASSHAGGPLGSGSAGSSAGGTAAQGRKIWIQPSGPRRPGEGVEDEEQGILSAEEVPTTGEVMMRITLLAAGFVIGPSGSSVREIVRLSGADINSWTEATGTHRGRRPARIFLIKGESSCVSQAVYVVTAAVDRYKELCEGKYSGQSVPRSQNVLGVTFSYQPPPKSIVPCAASLKELYAPPNTVANSARYAVSPPGLYGLNHPHSSSSSSRAAGGSRGLRGSPPPLPAYHHPYALYDRYDGWPAAAMMNAAAAMGLSPLQALAAAGGHHAAAAAAAGFGGLGGGLGHMFGSHGAASAGMMGFGGFEGPLNPLGAGTPPPGALDPMAAAAAGVPGGLNPYAAAMMGGADAFGHAAGSNMFGMLPAGSSAGGGPDAESAAAAAAAAAAAGPQGSMEGGLPGYGGPPGNPWWFPGMYDPTGMAALMAGAGLYGPLGAAAAANPAAAAAAAAAGSSGEGVFPQNPMSSAALAAAGLDAAALAAMDGSSGGLGRLQAGLGGPGASAAGSELNTPTAAAAGAASDAAGFTDSHRLDESAAGDTTAARGREAAADSSRDGRHTPPPHHHQQQQRGGPLWPGGLPPPSPFYRGPGLHLPHLIIPREPAEGAPHSPGSARARGLPHAGMPFPPASPGAPMLSFGPLFHPMSPAAPHMAPMSPYMGPVPAFGPVPPSPVRLMRDKSGQQIPYMEVGGTVYFAPASPMPPKMSPQRSGGRPAAPPPPPPTVPAAEEGDFQQQQQQGVAEQAGENMSSAGGADDHSSSPTMPSRGSSGGSSSAERASYQQQRPVSAEAAGHSSGSRGGSSAAAVGDDGRPRSALRLFTDNPYLTQDAIGSGAAGHHQQHYGSNGGSNAQQRRLQQQQWQAKRATGSSNSVMGPTGMQNGRQHTPSKSYGGGNSSSSNRSPVPPPPPAPAASAAAPASAHKASPEQQQQRDDAASDIDQSSPAPAAAAAPQPQSGSSFASAGRSPSMNELAAAGAAAGGSTANAAGGPAAGSSAARAREGWLDAYDPIVSPGRINLASKVKAARLYSHSAAAAAGQQAGKSGASPTGAMGSSSS